MFALTSAKLGTNPRDVFVLIDECHQNCYSNARREVQTLFPSLDFSFSSVFADKATIQNLVTQSEDFVYQAQSVRLSYQLTRLEFASSLHLVLLTSLSHQSATSLQCSSTSLLPNTLYWHLSLRISEIVSAPPNKSRNSLTLDQSQPEQVSAGEAASFIFHLPLFFARSEDPIGLLEGRGS